MKVERVFEELICLKSANGFEFGKVYAGTYSKDNERYYILGSNSFSKLHQTQLGNLTVLKTEAGAIFVLFNDFKPVFEIMEEGFSPVINKPVELEITTMDEKFKTSIEEGEEL